MLISNFKDKEDTTTIILEGHLNKTTFKQLHENCADITTSTVILDFGKVESIDSTGIASFLNCPYCSNRKVLISNSTGQPRKMLEHLKMLRYLYDKE